MTSQSNTSQGRGDDRLLSWNPKIWWNVN